MHSLLLLVFLAPADPGMQPLERRVGLRELLILAAEHYPEIPVIAAQQRSAEALADQATLARFTPRISNTTAFGVVPAARGTIFDSPDSPRDVDDLGPFIRTRFDLTQPIFTFGRLAGGQDAARALIDSRDARLEVKQNVARGLAARAYFGWLLAHQSLNIIADVRKQLEDLLETLENPKADAEPDPLDIFKARGYGFELDRLEATARRHRRVAEAGIGLLSGGQAVRILPAAEGLVAMEAPLPELDAGIAQAVESRPEIREAKHGARAKELQASITRRESLPALGFESRFEYSRADNRERQSNPFVYEPFNTRSLSFGFGVRWELNFLQTNAKARKDEADAAELRALKDALVARTRIELTEAHAKLEEAIRIHDSSRRAVSTTANWLRVADENHGLGTASVKDLIEAYSAYVQSRSAHLEAVHDLNLAVIDWRLQLGREPLNAEETP